MNICIVSTSEMKEQTASAFFVARVVFGLLDSLSTEKQGLHQCNGFFSTTACASVINTHTQCKLLDLLVGVKRIEDHTARFYCRNQFQ